MSNFNQNLPYAATPIDADELNALIPKYISLLSELNEVEQSNILKAMLWLDVTKKNDFYSISFIKKLHKKMFNNVWKWAGEFRRTNKNIGCDWPNIQENLQNLIHNVEYWIENKVYELDEIAVRLHHKLVLIHPFPNGNGRHARLYCDIFLDIQNLKQFTWGKGGTDGELVRKQYIHALRTADNKDYSLLLKFVRQ